MPGVFRPATFADVIGSMQDGIDAATSTGTSTSGVGFFTEADETLGVTDSATLTVQASPVWDAGTWGQFTWGTAASSPAAVFPASASASPGLFIPGEAVPGEPG